MCNLAIDASAHRDLLASGFLARLFMALSRFPADVSVIMAVLGAMRNLSMSAECVEAIIASRGVLPVGPCCWVLSC